MLIPTKELLPGQLEQVAYNAEIAMETILELLDEIEIDTSKSSFVVSKYRSKRTGLRFVLVEVERTNIEASMVLGEWTSVIG